MRVTTSNSFPIEDITHKPQRYQSEVAKEIGEAPKDTPHLNNSKIPTTLESLIAFFDNVATGKQTLPDTPKDIEKLAIVSSAFLKLSLITPRKIKDNSSEGSNENKD